MLLSLSPENNFAQSLFDLEGKSVFYTQPNDTIKIKWPKSNDPKNSLKVSFKGQPSLVYLEISPTKTCKVAKDTSLPINGHGSFIMSVLKESFKDSLDIELSIDNKTLKRTIIFLPKPTIFPDTLDFGDLIFNRWDNTISGVGKQPRSCKITNPLSKELRLESPHPWLRLLTSFVPPNSSVQVQFAVDAVEAIDTLNQETAFPFTNEYKHVSQEIKITKDGSIVLKNAKIDLRRTNSDTIFGIFILLLLGGIGSYFVSKNLIEKRLNVKIFHQIKSFVENKSSVPSNPFEREFLEGITKSVSAWTAQKSEERIVSILSSYQEKVKALPTGDVGKINALSVADAAKDAQKAALLVNDIIEVLNEKINLHQEHWRKLSKSFDKNVPFSVDDLQAMVGEVSDLREAHERQTYKISQLIQFLSVSDLDAAIGKIKENDNWLKTILRYLNDLFNVSGERLDIIREELQNRKTENDRDWSHLAHLFNSGSKPKEVKDKVEATIRNMADILDTHDTSIESIEKSLEAKIKEKDLFVRGIVDALEKKAKRNAPNTDFQIDKSNLSGIIAQIDNLRDLNYGKPPGFPDFVGNFKKYLRKVEQTLQDLSNTVRETNEPLFTGLLKTAHGIGRQKGVKPALDILSDESNLRQQLGINSNEMQYLEKKAFYTKFIRDFLDPYANDIARLHAYGLVDYKGFKMSDILEKEHGLKVSTIDGMYENLSEAYRAIEMELLMPKLFANFFDHNKHESSTSSSSFKGIYGNKYVEQFESIQSSMIYDLYEVGIRSETLEIYKKPVVFRK